MISIGVGIDYGVFHRHAFTERCSTPDATRNRR